MNIPLDITHRYVMSLLLILCVISPDFALAQNPPPGDGQQLPMPIHGEPPPPPVNPPLGPNNLPPPPPPFPESKIEMPAEQVQKTQVITTAEVVADTSPEPEKMSDSSPPPADIETKTLVNEELTTHNAAAVQTIPSTITETKVVLVKEPATRWLWLVLVSAAALFLGWWYSHQKASKLSEEKESLARSQRQLQSAHQHLKKHSEQLRELSIHDPLTGTLNRHAFAQELRNSLDHLAKFSRSMNLIVFDLDHFKSINDRLGHLTGDNALKLVVGIVRKHLVSEDLFSRFGGDEFIIACADQPIESTYALADAIRMDLLEQALTFEPPLTGLSLSMGISQSNPELGYHPDALFERADKALYAAKARGRNQVVICDDSLPDLPNIESLRRHI
jgi:diguanylate cyclase (GGDEF)-like protein